MRRKSIRGKVHCRCFRPYLALFKDGAGVGPEIYRAWCSVDGLDYRVLPGKWERCSETRFVPGGGQSDHRRLLSWIVEGVFAGFVVCLLLPHNKEYTSISVLLFWYGL